MKAGQYYYTKQGNSFAIFKCGETVNGVTCDENLHETKITQEEASERVYELNGWTWKKKSNPTPIKK